MATKEAQLLCVNTGSNRAKHSHQEGTASRACRTTKFSAKHNVLPEPFLLTQVVPEPLRLFGTYTENSSSR